MPHGRINSYSQALADPQVEHMGWVQDLVLPSGVHTKTFGSPIRVSGQSIKVRHPPPALGADTEAVLGGLSLPEAAE